MIFFRKYRIKRLTNRKKFLINIAIGWQYMRILVIQGKLKWSFSVIETDNYYRMWLDEIDEINEKLLNLGVNQIEADAIINLASKREIPA